MMIAALCVKQLKEREDDLASSVQALGVLWARSGSRQAFGAKGKSDPCSLQPLFSANTDTPTHDGSSNFCSCCSDETG